MATQRDALEAYFRSAVQGLGSASSVVVKARAQELKAAVQGQLRANFKRRVGGVSVKYLDPKGELGPAAYVSVKPQFLSVFEDGATIQRDRLMPILTPQGQQARFKRPGKKGLAAVLAAYKGQYRLAKTAIGYLVLIRRSPKAAEIPAYALVPQVRINKRLDFYGAAQKAGVGMDQEIANLVEAKI